MSDDPKTFTQDEVNSLLASEKRKHQEAFDAFKATVADHGDLGAQVAALTAERDELAGTVGTLTTERDGAAAKALRYEAAAEAGIELSLASRLTGDTKDDLVADAKALGSLIPKAPAPPTPTAPPAPKGAPEKGRAAEALRQMRRDA